MFTGLVEARVQVRRVVPQGTGLRLQLPRPEPGFDTARGDSIAVSGCCLTVAGWAEEGGWTGASDLVFRRNSTTGVVEVVPRAGTWEEGLNAALHSND